ncbi:protein IMPACT-B [Hydra vulgaris]|uniref:protein IMPACT-B n=1 Tax=Hydra vulgaris TaxID=6087 RepID=UPI001F5FD37C|nr:protein IMPACT-B-like [Hydra vulgaris]
MSDDIESQQDELSVLSSIYGKDFYLHNSNQFDICVSCEKDEWWAVTISGLLPLTYPSKDPPVFEIHTECLSTVELVAIHKELELLWNKNYGNPVLYSWVEKIREMLQEKYELAKMFIESTNEDKDREKKITSLLRNDESTKDDDCYTDGDLINFFSGEPMTVKKSTFQGHVAFVKSLNEVETFLSQLKRNRKVSQATHNIVAYRVCGINEGSYIQDYADDGEIHAGARLLHLLQIMDVKNIVVVVSRYFGGVLLGPDRFRQINNCARDVITQSGFFKLDTKKNLRKK